MYGTRFGFGYVKQLTHFEVRPFHYVDRERILHRRLRRVKHRCRNLLSCPPHSGRAERRSDGSIHACVQELEAGFTIEKAKVEAMKARLFARLREHFQRRDRLRLIIGYRRKYLESLVWQGEEEAGQIAQEYRQANAQQEQEYSETAAALAEKQESRQYGFDGCAASRSVDPRVAGAFKPRRKREEEHVTERR